MSHNDTSNCVNVRPPLIADGRQYATHSAPQRLGINLSRASLVVAALFGLVFGQPNGALLVSAAKLDPQRGSNKSQRVDNGEDDDGDLDEWRQPLDTFPNGG